MATVAVADSGPLITFARAGMLDLLHTTFDELVIPDAVYHEVVVTGQGRSGAHEVAVATWIRHATLADPYLLSTLPAPLHLGEREAILLALQLGLPLLVDDPNARREARRRGVQVAGSIAVLLDAKRTGAIVAVRPLLDRLIATGFRVGRRLYEDALRRVGEWP